MELLIIILLALNFIGVLFLTIRSIYFSQNDSRMEQNQKILESQMGLYREMLEVKAKLEYYYAAIKQESERLRAERQAFEASVKAAAIPKEEQNLLLNDRYKEIFALHEQGLTAEEIAKKLDKGCGEVSFILDLAAHEQA